MKKSLKEKLIQVLLNMVCCIPSVVMVYLVTTWTHIFTSDQGIILALIYFLHKMDDLYTTDLLNEMRKKNL